MTPTAAQPDSSDDSLVSSATDARFSLPASRSSAAIDLSAQINATFAEARSIASQASDNARAAVLKALECGRLLQNQKASLPHGAWQDWLTQHCPEISASTARRYIRLSKRSHMTVLQDATSLRQAYLATGVLPESPRDRTPSPTAPTVTFVRGLDHFRRWFNRRTEELPLDKWTPEARRLLRNELTWFKTLYDDLVAEPALTRKTRN